MDWFTLAMVLQVSVMLHQDAYTYTQPYVGRYFLSYSDGRPDTRRSWPTYWKMLPNYRWDGTPFHVPMEANPVSAWFQQNGMLPVYDAGSILATAGTAELLREFDRDHLKGCPIGTKDLFLAGMAVMEMDAMHTWVSTGYGPPEASWTFFRADFN